MTVYPGIVFKDGDPIIGSLNAEIICLRKLIDSTRSGFIKMAEENIQLHLDIDVFKDENERLTNEFHRVKRI